MGKLPAGPGGGVKMSIWGVGRRLRLARWIPRAPASRGLLGWGGHSGSGMSWVGLSWERAGRCTVLRIFNVVISPLGSWRANATSFEAFRRQALEGNGDARGGWSPRRSRSSMACSGFAGRWRQD